MDLRDNLEGHSGFAMGRRVALIIGNSNYRGSISSLLNPANDARDVARSIESVGFDVDLLLDATRDEMNKAVLAFKDRLHDSDVGLFYYAGHAVQVNGRNFMMPVESDLQITDMRQDTLADYVSLETVEIDHVLGRMAAAEPDLNIVILDACRDNPFKGSTRGLSRGLAQTLAPRGTFIAYATAPGKVAEDGRGNNSPYTSALVEAVKIPGLKIEDVFKQVRRDVALQTDGRQTPWENSSIYGDFYFTPPAPTPPLTATLPEPLPAPAPEKAPVTATIPDILPTPENRTAPSESPARVQAQTPAPVDEDETTVRSKRPSINRFIITP
ncbi:MAG: caspase family protein [Alphaproteobacteria bacterium]|nr:caspase family protein [Alphaproteobacteria bacterium]